MLTRESARNDHGVYRLVFLDFLREILLEYNLTVVSVIG